MRRIIPLFLIIILFICSGFQLKKDVAKTLTVGKFISKTDGYTAKTDLTNASVTIKVRYNGGSATMLSSNGWENECDGFYKYTFTPDTFGHCVLDVSNDGCLPFFQVFEIVAELDNNELSTIKTNVNIINNKIDRIRK